MAHQNERVQLEMKIMKYRQLARQASSDEVTRQRIEELISELESSAKLTSEQVARLTVAS